MNLVISEAAFRHTPAAIHGNAGVDVISYAIGDSALCRVLIAHSVSGVCGILIGSHDDELEADLVARFPSSRIVANDDGVHDDLANVIRFVDKPAEGLRLTLDMRGTAFQRRVWEKLRATPVGKTITYLGLARWISPLASPRGVAGACAANPIALAIPCHRVVCGNGGLAGYRWGIERKRELIRNEATP